jgi:phosphoribosyl 1,2-cyclic phosphodiesterase
MRVGGNTSCVSVEAEDELVILDAGSGLRELGLRYGDEALRATILLSHYHWDHLLGFPAFGPIFNPESELVIYGEGKKTGDARSALETQFAAPHFPVPFEDVAAKLYFHPVAPGDSFTLGPMTVKVGRLNHPNLAVCYRVERNGKSLVYATDHEHDNPDRHRDLAEFAKGADLLIYDATFDDAEYPFYKGWGHSTWQEALKLGEKAEVGQVIIFHHDPSRDDDAAEAIEAKAKKISPNSIIAREGMIIKL